MNDQEKAQARKDILRYRKGVVFNLKAAEMRIERIRVEGKPEWYEWMELATISGKRACLEDLDRCLESLDNSA